MKHRQSGFAHLSLALVLPVLFVIGVGYYVYQQNNNSNQLNSESNDETVSLTDPLPTDLKTVDEIKAIVMDQKPDAVIGSVELEVEDGIYVYRVELVGGDKLVYDAVTGEPVAAPGEDDGEKLEKKLPDGFELGITFEQARSIAMEKYPDKTIHKIKLKVTHNKVIYRVYFANGYQVDIDAGSGDIIRLNKENHDSNNQSSHGGSSSHESGSHEDSDNSDSGGSDDESGDSSGSDDGDHNSGDNSGSDSGDDGSGLDD